MQMAPALLELVETKNGFETWWQRKARATRLHDRSVPGEPARLVQEFAKLNAPPLTTVINCAGVLEGGLSAPRSARWRT